MAAHAIEPWMAAHAIEPQVEKGPGISAEPFFNLKIYFLPIPFATMTSRPVTAVPIKIARM
jgi:hypothetical protein